MRLDKATIYRLRQALRNDLQTTQRRFAKGEGELTYWFWGKMEGLMAYGAADKESIDPKFFEIIRLRFVEGWTESMVARKFKVSDKTVERWVNIVLDSIVEQMPLEMAQAVVQGSSAGWRDSVTCQKCFSVGLQFWDGDPIDPGWKCFECNYLQRADKPVDRKAGERPR